MINKSFGAHNGAHKSLGARMSAQTSLGAHISGHMRSFLPRAPLCIEGLSGPFCGRYFYAFVRQDDFLKIIVLMS